ncbi:MAG: methyltransferase domain-containing protein [Gammaproteobacteria bacterium]|nr:methyltransferase domain-containing protein [Gammaproteobacteria bacterium]MCW8841675.1 methyltransferase domain-containing protein [Gammaproteobacteria bacterium]MCW8958819.1 methyltransferase domain-containing protein [Gammaproteobacteria bacterium]MCW8972031.1 methyltransferase domain-containing protein [Gammaproteobacteria bacterium]MCW8993203.1 methyltransferase domain-containing protein [Gammaproteobacteria bacterium]
MQEYQVKFETLTIGNSDFYIRSLLDRQQYYDPEGVAARANIPPSMWPIFGLVWPAGLFLAQTMCHFPCDDKRILEIGCGLGLASLALHRAGADITSTDQHPLAETFLEENLALNDLTPMPFHIGSWEESDLELEKFDLIIGSDLLYETAHPALLAGFIDRHANDEVEVIIVDPGRGHHGKFKRAMERLGYRLETEWSAQQDIKRTLSRGHLLNYRRGLH